jgi:hypothetical protein
MIPLFHPRAKAPGLNRLRRTRGMNAPLQFPTSTQISTLYWTFANCEMTLKKQGDLG